MGWGWVGNDSMVLIRVMVEWVGVGLGILEVSSNLNDSVALIRVMVEWGGLGILEGSSNPNDSLTLIRVRVRVGWGSWRSRQTLMTLWF